MSFSLTVLWLSALAMATLGQDDSELVASANNDAAVTIYKTLNGNGNSNVICSPLSISTVLSLVLAGANGNTATEISQTLGYSKLTQNQINNGYKKLLPSLAGNTDYILNIANSIWISKQITALPTYESTVTTDYYSEVKSLDSADPAKQINNWVNSKTNGMIPVLFDRLDNNVVMVLVNAIYFKGTWVTAFQAKLTKSLPFKSKSGSNKMIPQMNLLSNFNYSESNVLNAQVLEMPYKGNSVSMIVFLPLASNDIDTLESDLKYSDVYSAIDQMTTQKVDVTIPKFKSESTFPLNDPLMVLGIKQAFENSADFSGISNSSLKISTTIHKAVIEVDEAGTKAAAATGIGMVRTASIQAPRRVFTFVADHPFIYILFHRPSSSILFLGSFKQP